MTEAQKTEEVKKKFAKKTVKKDELFAMDFWEDERLMRKFMKENMLCISQNAAANGVKSHFTRSKDNEAGMHTMEVQFATEREEVSKDGSKRKIVEFDGNNYIRVTFDPNRKFPVAKKDDETKEKKALPTFVKWRP